MPSVLSLRVQPRSSVQVLATPLFALALFVCLTTHRASAAHLLDFWDHACRTTVVHAPNTNPLGEENSPKRKKPEFQNPAVTLRYDRVHDGAFSLEVNPPKAPSAVTFLTNIWTHQFEVPSASVFEFWLAAAKEGETSLPAELPVSLALESSEKIKVSAVRGEADRGWTRYTASLKNGGNIRAITLDLSMLPAPGSILLDGAGFRSGDLFIGVTDKPLDQWMNETAMTRAERVKNAFLVGTTTDFSGAERQWFDKLWSGQETAESNAALRKFFQDQLDLIKAAKADLWSLSMNVRLVEMYYELGSRSGRNPVPLEPATEKLLLELLWQRTQADNDIGWAKSNTWWLTGSENHDLNAKVSCLISSRIFMGEPDYRHRLYPDAAHAPGYGYWFSTIMTGGEGYGPETAASWQPSGQHNAADHYRAWVAFFDRYITERAKRGFFLERAAPGYMKWTLDFLYTAHRYCGDEGLQKKLGDFLDLAWADWAQEQLGGLRGGPKTRHHHTVGGYDSMSDMERFLLGGPGSTLHIYTALLLDDKNALPAPIVDLALDTRGRGRYALVSRGIGEEEAAFPRPAGTERTLTVDKVSRFLKYSWVTPDYILGTQMDHPAAVQSHLSAVGRWHGLIVGASPDTRILPTGGLEENSAGGKPQIDMERMYQTAQERNILVIQQARRWMQASPDWYPSGLMYARPIVLNVGKGWDEKAEQAGWLFFRKQAAYAAVRVVDRKTTQDPKGNALHLPIDETLPGHPDLLAPADKTWEWNEEGTGLRLNDMFSPVIIYAGSADEHGDFASFQKTVLNSRLELHKTVVPGYFSVVFQGGEKEAREIRFSANTPGIPILGGSAVNYLPEALFSGPFIQSRFGSGQFRIAKGANALDLDFKSNPRP